MMKTRLIVEVLLGSILAISTLFGQACQPQKTIHEKIEEDTNAIMETLIDIRRDFHQFPELAKYEKRTSKRIAEYLLDLGLEVKTNVAGYGVIGILKGGGKGKNIAWRADMDAIPSHYPEKSPYKSKIMGVQHGCGHDVHMAIGLGIAEVLSKNKAAINGTVYFIFQPEEETFLGAKKIAESSLYQEFDLEEIYALHVTALPVGQLMVRPNELYAYQKIAQLKFDSTFTKKDANELLDLMRNKTLRTEEDANPWQVPLAFDSIVGLQSPNTIFKDYMFVDKAFFLNEEDNEHNLIASMYETKKPNLPSILPTVEEIIRESEYGDAFISASYIQENPTVLNHEKLTKEAFTILTNLFGENAIETSHGQIPYFNDDFIYFQQKTPGVYFLLGGSNPDKGISAMNHGPNFDVDEACISVGVKSFSSLIIERMKTF